MTLFEFDDQLAPIRTGRFAEPVAVLVWLVALAATAVTPAGLVVAGALLGLSATSVSRAVAAGSTFGIVVVGAGWLWVVVTGSPPVVLPAFFDLSLFWVALTALLVPPTVAAAVRWVG